MGEPAMDENDLFSAPHRRRNMLTGEWLLVSPQRTARPWQGQVEAVPPETRPTYDPTCYLCPGNARAGGARNPDYTGTFVFENDYAALRPDTPSQEITRPFDDRDTPLMRAASERGLCRVVC